MLGAHEIVGIPPTLCETVFPAPLPEINGLSRHRPREGQLIHTNRDGTR